MPTVNPEVLIWARETAGMPIELAARKVGIRQARGMSAAERLAALESGEQVPTRATIVRMAKQYRRPLIAFYMAGPPRRGRRGVDFRTLTAPLSDGTEALVDALVLNVLARQSMVRAALEAEDEDVPVPFVGSLRPGQPSEEARRAIDQIVGANALPAYRSRPSKRGAFSLLRERVEQAGVFALLKGDLGSSHTALEVEAFRGFAIADPIAPFIVINDNDSAAAWSFTLLHELVHLLLGNTGLSGSSQDHEVEQFCSRVAGEWLLPDNELAAFETGHDGPTEGRIREFARARNLSSTLVAYRLLLAGGIGREAYATLAAAFRTHWRRSRKEARRERKASGGFVPWYTVRRHRLGNALVSFGRRMVDSGALSTTKAARILDVKPLQVQKLLSA